jgi:Sec-independent protein translocase protein TatA
MKSKDLLALAALAGGVAAFKNKMDKDVAELPEQKEAAERQAKKRAALDAFVAQNRKETPEEIRATRRQAAYEELNPENQTGRRRLPLTDRYGSPVTTRFGGYAHTEGSPDSAMQGANSQRNVGMKKGGAVKAKSASSRADGIAQRGKTKGRIV